MKSLITILLVAAMSFQVVTPVSNPSNNETSFLETLFQPKETVPNYAKQDSQQVADLKQEEPLKLDITATPQLVKPGETVTISWNFSSLAKLNAKKKELSDVTFELTLPKGVSSVTKLESVTDKYGTTSTLSMAAAAGSVSLNIAKDAEIPLVIDVTLRTGKKVIAADSVLLSEPSFQLTTGNAASFTSSDGKVKLQFSEAAASETLLMDIRTPGPSNDRNYSLSGLPIEILAVGEKTRTNVNKFKQNMILTVQYDPEKIFDWAPEDLSLFYYDEATQDWWPIATTVNTKTHELTAQVDHLTVFDYKANSWQGSRTPTVDGAQVSSYTGAATYNMSFWTPPAPGGFQPTVSLDYNSQVIDNSTAFTQASWVGMGWSLDTGYIERNMHGTNSDLTDDTFSLLLGGVSTQLLPISTSGSITTYSAKNINYWTIEFDSSTGNWTVYDQTGTTYHLNDQAKTHTTNGCVTSLANLDLTWRWSLSSAVDKFGNTISYSYVKQAKTTTCVNQVTVYPEYITYPNGQYRVSFVLESRTDYQSAWEATDSKNFFSNQRLDYILIQQLVSGSWTNIRQYDFSYADGATNQIYPPFTWTKGGTRAKTLTLIGVQEKSGDGNTNLPTTTFSYSDYMHMTTVNNGQGGSVTFNYERWHYLDDTNKDIRHILTTFGDYPQECWEPYGPNGTVWYTYNGYGSTKCEASMLQIDKLSSSIGIGVREFPQHMIKPGGHYRMFLQVRNIYQTTGVEWGFIDGYHSADIEGIYNGIGTSFVYPEFGGEMPVFFDPNNTKMIIECDNCYVKKVDFALMPLYYRVTSKTVTDSAVTPTTGATYAYNYDEPTANDTYHSVAAQKTDDLTKYYVPPMRDYRGNAMTLITAPNNLLDTTWFYQNDLLSGSPYRTLTSSQDLFDGFDNFNTTNWTYSHQGTRQNFALLNGDATLANFNLASDWTSVVNRTGSTLTDGDVMYAQFNLTGAYTQNEMGITNSSDDFFGLIVQPSGSTDYVKLRTKVSGTPTDSTILIPDTSFKRGVWYMVMIFVDANDGFHIRVWDKSNPQVYGEASSSMNGSVGWHFQQKTYSGTVYLDTYLEGVPYSETETSYTTNVLYDTDTTTTTIPNLASTGLMNFVDLQVNRVYANATISRLFDKDYSFIGTRTTYDFNTADQGNAQYGNLTRTVESSWNGTQWVDYRASKTEFVPNAANHLTMLPARSISLDCASSCDFTNETGKDAESMQLYDNATSATTAPTYGKPTATRTWVTGTQYSQVNVGYDAYGNQTSQTTFTGYGTATSAPTTGSSITSMAYETTYNTYATSSTNALNQTTSTAYNYTLGVPISMTDPNSATTSAEYDVFGRMVKVIAPGDTTTSPTLGITYYDTRIPFQVDLKQKVNDSASIRLTRFYSGLGNLIQTQTVGVVVNGTSTLLNVVEDTQFDNLNRAVKTTKPNTFTYNATPTFRSQDFTQPLTQTAYDLLGRPITITEPNANVTTYTYDGLITSVTDPANNTTTSQKDAWGRVVLVDAPTGPDLTYTYNTRNLLTQVQSGTGSTAIQTNITYNQAGLKTAMDDPDMGDWTYSYDGSGNLISQTDARSCATNLSYDALARLTGKTYSGASGCSATPAITYTYDVGTNAIGHRSSMADGSGSTAWTFDNRGRTLSETKTIGTESFTSSWTYNSADQPVTMTYPDNEVLTYGYNSQGSLNTISSSLENYLTAVNYDAVGRITQMKLGTNDLLQKTFTYYDWTTSVNGGKLSNATVTNNSSATLMNLGYSYDSRGNINQIIDSSASETSAFTYDAISRLTAMIVTSGGNTIHSEAFTYDSANGNLTGKGSSTTTLTSYTYGGTQPHAVTETNALTEPAAGTPTDSVVVYTYDGDGSMVKSVIDGKTTYYPSSYYEKRMNAGQTTVLKYYYIGSARLAVREGTTLTWLVSNNLGSTSMTVNGSGTVLNTIKYTAFGEIRSGTTDKTDYQYTGQRNEEEIGLYFYNARWYDPSLGRFAQADTLVPDPASLKSYDRYAYVNNNPINFNDPTGQKACDDQYGCNSIDKKVKAKPNKTTLFQQLPISPKKITGVQWFGGTQRAYDIMMSEWNLYKYCQYGHCGFDILADYDTPIYSGVYGTVLKTVTSDKPEQGTKEGPYKVMIQSNDKVITFGHTNGMAYVQPGQQVYPWTLISGVGNMGGYEGSGEIDHVHIEIRGPGGWSGPSLNPFLEFPEIYQGLLIDIAKNQTNQPEMGKFTNGIDVFDYPPPSYLMPDSLNRTNGDTSPFYKK